MLGAFGSAEHPWRDGPLGPSAATPRGVPKDWVEQAGKKEGNAKYVNPVNPHDYVRVKPDRRITQVTIGQAFDVNGNRVDLRSPGSYGFTPDEFISRE